eukprot:m.38237 g.38237  ORF g.38237 m.38237 type:complete len:71 (+) comp10194_c0_seq1:1046-1258(+)
MAPNSAACPSNKNSPFLMSLKRGTGKHKDPIHQQRQQRNPNNVTTRSSHCRKKKEKKEKKSDNVSAGVKI